MMNRLSRLSWPGRRWRDQPTERELRQWACCEWVEYQAWVFHHGFPTLHDWRLQRREALRMGGPLISILTPVYNTAPNQLRECARGVLTQTYPHWEWRVVDDGGDRAETAQVLAELAGWDRRFKIHRAADNQGICGATNQALGLARGAFCAFLDHDDRLAPDALFHLAAHLRAAPDTDIVYSDRDMISPQGARFMHLFKPDWSPETLLSGNYCFHLMAYRRELLRDLGGLRAAYEGSQDFDLLLRATDQARGVGHIPRVLYHWRQHPESIALDVDSKSYTFAAGIRALEDTLSRRGLRGRVEENPLLWRGNYRVRLEPSSGQVAVVSVNLDETYAEALTQADRQAEFWLLVDRNLTWDGQAVNEMLGWMQIEAVGLVTAKILDGAGHLIHGGLVHRPSGTPLAIYAGEPADTPSYLGSTAIARNVSAPHPGACLIRRAAWEKLGGTQYQGPHGLLDFALRAAEQGIRTVYQPFAEFRVSGSPPAAAEQWPERERFANDWARWLAQGDPYYNRWLTLDLADMGLELFGWRKESH